MKIVLISQQGSGTNLLRSFLNSHSDIYIENELFSKDCKTIFHDCFKRSNQNLEVYLDQFYKGRFKVIGFDLKYNQIEPGMFDFFKENDIRVIQFIRNPGRTFLRNINETHKRNFRYTEIIQHCSYVKKWIEIVQEIFPNSSEFYYEDMTRGREIKKLPIDFEKRILKFLEVEYQKLKLTKSFKQLIIRY